MPMELRQYRIRSTPPMKRLRHALSEDARQLPPLDDEIVWPLDGWRKTGDALDSFRQRDTGSNRQQAHRTFSG